MFIYNKLFDKLNDLEINAHMLQHYYELSRSVVRRIQNRKGINMESLEHLARILKCDTSDLYEYVDVDGKIENSIRRSKQKIEERYHRKKPFKKWKHQSTEKPKKKKTKKKRASGSGKGKA